MKFIRLLIIIILITAVLAGCQRNDDTVKDTPTPEQTATGGVTEPAENVNVKDIDIVKDGDDTVVTISMLSGSRKNGYTESKLLDLPKYEITMLENPQRLKITLDNISFWDYEQKESWELSSFAVGLFREVSADDDSLVIYVQLTQNASFSVEESDGDLSITISPQQAETTPSYFCVVDAFLEHQDGAWPDDIEMHPVLCADGINKLLISGPFDLENEAIEFAEEQNAYLQSSFEDKELYVISLQPGTLPNYEIHETELALEGYSAVLSDGAKSETPPLIENGRYLCASPDGRIAFSRRYKPEEPSMEQDVYLLSDKVWILDKNGRMTELDMPEFFSVEKAQFSSDGTLLAILDVSIENSVLYVYDFAKETAYNLGEEGFGSMTDSFAWSDSENILYAMTGPDSGSVQLMGVRFSEERPVVFAVEEQAGGAGSLEVSNGKIYFADRTQADGGIVYVITDTRKLLFPGVDIKVSPDGKSLLVLESFSSVDEERTTNLKLCDIETMECRYIAENVSIEDFGFSLSSSDIYYTKPAEEPVEEYIFEFVSYDTVTDTEQTLALLSSSSFEVSKQPGVIYIIKEIIDDDQYIIATFIYDLNKGE